MAESTVHDHRLLDDLAAYERVVVAYPDDTGYPLNVATSFRGDPEAGTILLDPLSAPAQPAEGEEVTLIFSHVRPQPGVGYDERRYVTVWGTLARRGDGFEVTPTRTHGWDEQRLPFPELIERSVPRGLDYMRDVSAETGRTRRPTLSRGWLFFSATRVPFLTATLVPVLLGALIARHHGFSAWWHTVLALVGAMAIHLGLNVVNDVYDTESGADAANVTPTAFSGGSRVIQYGLVTLSQMKRMALVLYGIGIAIGLFLAVTRGWGLLWLGVAGVFLSIFYTAPPFKLAYRGLGDVAVALGFGPIMVLGAYYVVAQRYSWEAFYASLPVAILIMLVLYANQVPDRKGDAIGGKRTVAVRYSPQAITRGYLGFVILAGALIVIGAFTLMPIWTLLGLLPFPFGWRVYQALRQHYDAPYELMPALGENVALHGLSGLGLILGYLAAIVF